MSNLANKASVNQPFKPSDYEKIIEFALNCATKQGASQAEVSFSTSIGLSLSVRLQEVENIEYCRDKGVSISVYFGQKRGEASSSDTSVEAIEAAVVKACDIAKVTGVDECFGLPDKALFSKNYPNLDLYHPWQISPLEAIQLASVCEQQALKNKQIKTSEGADFNSFDSYQVYGNSHGFIGGYATSRHSLSCVLIAEDGDNMLRDYDYTTARDPKDLWTPEQVGQGAVEKTLARLQARKIKTQKAPVIFAKEVSSSLLSSLIAAISGGNLYKRSSFLVDSLGKSVLPERYSIYENPHLEKGLGSAPFDGDGLITRNNYFIRHGMVENYVLSTYSARRLGMTSTANAGGVHNLTLTHDNQSLPELMKMMGDGLLVTELMGQGVSIVTGNYSRGAAGFWIENGEIAFPVNEITIAGNLKDMFSNILAVGNDIDIRKSIQCGSIFIENMSIAGD